MSRHMNWTRTPLFGLSAAVLLFLCLTFPSRAADSLTWRRAPDRVDAEIEGWPLPRLLQQISDATGWDVYLQPETELPRPVSVRFKNVPIGEALGKLLGSLNYALAPQTNGPAKLFVFRTALGAATELFRREKPKSGKPIPDELIVSLKPRGGNMDDLARRLGGKIVGREDTLRAYRLKFPDEAAAQAARASLSGNSDVALLDYNYPVLRPPAPDLAGGAGAPALSIKPGAGPDASRLIIGLIDTPVQPLGSPYKEFLLPALSVMGEAPADDQTLRHGSSMLETILRGLEQAPQANRPTPVRILPVDVYGSSDTTTTFEVARGIVAAINHGAAIINLSLAGDGDSQFLHNIITQGFDRGVLFVAAAGNEPTTTPTYPAAYPEVLAVTAGTPQTGQIAPWANYGAFVDVVGPGTSLVDFGGRTFRVTGTSVSTAYVAGFAAGLSVSRGAKPINSVKNLLPYFSLSPTPRP